MPAKKLNKKLSHFSDQLRRQHDLSGVAMWEMFYDNRLSGSTSGKYDRYGSSCIWHKDAFKHLKKNIFCRAWKNDDINAIAKCNIYDVVKSILSCEQGQPLEIKDGKVQILKNNEIDNIAIPIPIPIPPEFSERYNKEIINFMKEHGLSSYFYIDLREFKLQNNL